MRVVFIGTGEIGLPVLKFLLQAKEHQLAGVVTQPDKPAGREQRMQAPPIKLALAETAIPILQPERIKRAEAAAAIQQLEPDVIVVMAYGQILPRPILEIPKVACLNLHASLLPKHRGAAPIQAAIVAGDDETGITVIYMDEGLDTGDILLQSPIPLAPNETGGSLHDRLGEVAPMALEEALRRLASETAPRILQNDIEATYAPKLEREHGRIDWAESAAMIERKIRAFNPWPTAYMMLPDENGRERKLKIFSATLLPEFPHDSGQWAIAAKDGVLSLGEVQLEGKKRMSAKEFRRGFKGLSS